MLLIITIFAIIALAIIIKKYEKPINCCCSCKWFPECHGDNWTRNTAEMPACEEFEELKRK